MTSHHSKSLLIMLSLISVVLLAALTLGVYYVRAQNQETSEMLNIVDQATEVETLTQSIRMIQNSSAEDITALDGFVLSSEKLVSLIEEIEGVGRAVGVDVDILSVEKVENKKTNEQSTIRLSMETHDTWASTLAFIRAMESLPHRVMVEGSTLSREETDWRSRLVLSLYLFD